MDDHQKLWDEYDRAMATDDFETARRILDRIPPLSDEEWRRKLDEAPMDDEPVSQAQLRRFEELEAALMRSAGRRTG